MPVKPIKPEPKASKRRGALHIREKMREEILWLRREPGSVIDEIELSKEFGLSRTPVREALLLLAGDELVVFLPNRSALVVPLSLDNLGHMTDITLVLSRSVAIAAAGAGKIDEAQFQQVLDRFQKALEKRDFEQALKEDNIFRRQLAALSENKYLIDFYDRTIDNSIRMKLLHYFTNTTPKDLTTAVESVRNLYAAILSGDTIASDEAMKQVIYNEIAIVVRSLEPRFAPKMQL